MKTKLIYVLLCAITLISISSILLINPESGNGSTNITAERRESEYIYTIGEYSGMVAVFNYGKDTPLQILECPVDSLPDEEAKQLLDGINIKSDEELQYLIEAYD